MRKRYKTVLLRFTPEELAVLDQKVSRTNLSRQVVESVRQYFDGKTYETLIPRNVRLAEAPSHGMSIFEYDPRSVGADAYRALAKEIEMFHVEQSEKPAENDQ